MASSAIGAFCEKKTFVGRSSRWPQFTQPPPPQSFSPSSATCLLDGYSGTQNGPSISQDRCCRTLAFAICRLCVDSDRLRRCNGRRRTTFQIGAAGLANVNAALEERTLLDRNSRCDHVAGERAFAANIHAIAGLAVTTNLTQHDDLARYDVRGNLAIAAHGHTISRQIDCTFDLAVDVQRFGACQLALDDQRLANRRLLARWDGRGRSSTTNGRRSSRAGLKGGRRGRRTHRFRGWG